MDIASDHDFEALVEKLCDSGLYRDEAVGWLDSVIASRVASYLSARFPQEEENIMGFSHKSAIIEGTKALDEWAMQNEIAETVDWAGLRRVVNIFNPELHECNNPECPVDTWTGPKDDCPACGVEGEKAGRRVR